MIHYFYDNGRLYFGRITFWSYIAAFFVPGRFFEVKPIKGYEEYAYYKNGLLQTVGDGHLTNKLFKDQTPLEAIQYHLWMREKIFKQGK